MIVAAHTRPSSSGNISSINIISSGSCGTTSLTNCRSGSLDLISITVVSNTHPAQQPRTAERQMSFVWDESGVGLVWIWGPVGVNTPDSWTSMSPFGCVFSLDFPCHCLSCLDSGTSFFRDHGSHGRFGHVPVLFTWCSFQYTLHIFW